jgi:hypothetical protein
MAFDLKELSRREKERPLGHELHRALDPLEAIALFH